MKLADIKPGDYVYGWAETGTRYNGTEQSPFYARVIRVNRLTVTVVDENGHTQRVDPYHFEAHASNDAIADLRRRGRLL
jgi:hypothetical protein